MNISFLFCELDLENQALTNCVHGYDHARNVHANGITLTQKLVHVIDTYM